MEEKNKDDVKKEENFDETKTEVFDSEEEVLDNDEELIEDPENVTREINLDDLYDGAVNNTVVIDPITNNEILLADKKPNYTIVGIIVAVIILLVLYYVNNKSDLGRTTKDVEPKVTTTAKEETEDNTKGTLTCNYEAKSDAESQTVTYTANYEKNMVSKSEFNFVAQLLTDNE